MNTIIKRATLSFAGALCFASVAVADTTNTCGDVSIAEYNWSSGAFFANLDKFILENGFGCDVELVQGGTVPIATSLREKGKPDIAGEVWVSTVDKIVTSALGEGRAFIANAEPISGGASENWYVTPYTLEQNPQIKTVQDIINNPDLFEGKVHICPAGWGCNTTTTNIMAAYEAVDKGWELVMPGSGAALDGSIANANQRNKNWFGFYWAPAGMIGKYDLVPVPTGTGFAGEQVWKNCITNAECENPVVTEFSKPTINTLVTDKVNQNNSLMDYLGKRNIDVNLLNTLLIKMDEQQESAEDAVITFLKEREDLWTAWVDADTLAKVKASL